MIKESRRAYGSRGLARLSSVRLGLSSSGLLSSGGLLSGASLGGGGLLRSSLLGGGLLQNTGQLNKQGMGVGWKVEAGTYLSRLGGIFLCQLHGTRGAYDALVEVNTRDGCTVTA